MTGQAPAGGGVARQPCCPARAGPTPDLCGQLEVSGGSSEPLLQDFELPQMTGHSSISDSCHARGAVVSWWVMQGRAGAFQGGPLGSSVGRKLSAAC